MRLFVTMLAAVILMANPSLAGGSHHGQPSGSTATAIGVGMGIGKGGEASSNSSSNAGGSSSSVNVESHRQAPGFAVFASGPCSGAAGAVSTPFGGLGLGTTDTECAKREAARLGMASDDPEIRALAKKVFLSLEAVQAIMAHDRQANAFWCEKVTAASSATDRAACAK